jgi:hypothetical protein
MIFFLMWLGDPVSMNIPLDYIPPPEEIVLIQPYEPEEQHNESNQRTSEDPEIDERWWNQ